MFFKTFFLIALLIVLLAAEGFNKDELELINK